MDKDVVRIKSTLGKHHMDYCIHSTIPNWWNHISRGTNSDTRYHKPYTASCYRERNSSFRIKKEKFRFNNWYVGM